MANSTIRPTYGALGSRVRVPTGLQSCVGDILNSVFLFMYYLVGTEENCTNEDNHDFHSPPNVMQVIILRRMISARRVVQVER